MISFKVITKKFLKVVSWIGFFTLTFSICSAIGCTFGGVAALIFMLINMDFPITIQSFAIGYFSAIAVTILLLIIFSISELIRRAVQKV